MPVRHQAFLPISSLLLTGIAVWGQGSNQAARASSHGTIVLGGGYFNQEESTSLLRRVIDLAGDAGVSLVIIPTADPSLEPAARRGPSTTLSDYEKKAGASFTRLGVQKVTVLHTRDRAAADSEEFAALLRSADAVWIPGGDPELLFRVYRDTRVQRELQGVLNRGGLIAGDSAGAILIGEGQLAIDLNNKGGMPALSETGLRLLPNVFVLPHLNRYKSGVVEAGCETFVSAHPDASCILIEENTSVMIRHDQIGRLIGNGKTGIVESRGRGAGSVVWLSGSERYDFRLRNIVH